MQQSNPHKNTKLYNLCTFRFIPFPCNYFDHHQAETNSSTNGKLYKGGTDYSIPLYCIVLYCIYLHSINLYKDVETVIITICNLHVV